MAPDIDKKLNYSNDQRIRQNDHDLKAVEVRFSDGLQDVAVVVDREKLPLLTFWLQK
jgi:hypothetical protein